MELVLLSHRFGNIGHAMMAIGVEEIVRATFGRQAEVSHLEQHHTFSVYPKRNPLYYLDKIQMLRRPGLLAMLNRPGLSRWAWRGSKHYNGVKLAIACGGPSLAPGSAKSPEHVALLNHMYGAIASRSVPIIDVGLGSCVPYSQLGAPLGQTFTDGDFEVFRRMIQYTAKTFVREKVAQEIMAKLGRQCELIPCAALLSARAFQQHRPRPGAKLRIAINYQKNGANSTWGQGVDPGRWAETVKSLVTRLSARHEVFFLCQSPSELQLAEQFMPSVSRVQPENPIDYMRVISSVSAAVVSRVHAALPLASFGIPSVAVGTDSRLFTLQTVGLKTHFVGNVTVDHLEADLEAILGNRAQEYERLMALREETLAKYVDRLNSIVA